MCKYMYCNRLISNRISEYRLTWGKILRYSKVVFPWCWRSMEVLPLTCVELLCTVCTCHCKNRRLAKTTMVQNMPSTVTCQGHPAAVLWIDVKRAAVRLAVDISRDLDFDCSFTKNVFGFKNGPDRIWTCSEDANHNDLYWTMLRWALWGPCFATAEAQASYAVAGKIAVFQRRSHRGVDPTMT